MNSTWSRWRLGVDVDSRACARAAAAEQRVSRKASGSAARNGRPSAVDQNDGDVAARHGEGAVREVDEVHQPERDGEPARQHEQQHAVGDAVEQDGQHDWSTAARALDRLRAFAGIGDTLQHYFFSPARVLDRLEGRELDVVELAVRPSRPCGCRCSARCRASPRSIEIGPRGLSTLMPFIAAISASPSVSPLVFFSAS